jgi:predicted PurR-regulated permease PerM
MAVLLSAWRLIQDYYTTPRIMGRNLKIHPLAAIFAVLVGAEIGGIVGIYLAIPLMASLRVIWRACTGEQTYFQDKSSLAAKASSSLVEPAVI